MANYYDILKLQTDATPEQIQSACDNLYNVWRRLVTHQQPEIVTQANQNLALVEKMRSTLLDPVKREAYDEGIGLGSNVSELADPNAIVATISRTPPTTLPEPILKSQRQHAPWQCSNCGSTNDRGSIFCSSCGTTIGQQCPNCNTIYEITAHFCSSCGLSPQEYRDRQVRAQAESEHQLRQNIQVQLAQVETYLQAKQFRMAQVALTTFEGLGKVEPNSKEYPYSIICPRTRPEWQAAEILAKNADSMKGELIQRMLPFTGIGYAIVGLVLGANYGSNSNTNQGNYALIGLIVGIILGLIGPALYYHKWGGRSSGQDELLAALTPLGMGILLYIGLIVVIIVIALFILAAVLGGG